MMVSEQDWRPSGHETAMMRKTVLLMDDHPVVALGINLALRDCPTLSLVGVASSPGDALEAIAAQSPDALVLDLVFSGAVHLSLIRDSRLALPHAAIVVFTSLPARLYKNGALAAGADAYLTKDSDLSVLVSLLSDLCVRPDGPGFPTPDKTLVSHKRLLAAPGVTKALLGLGDGIHLTRREREIAEFMAQGLSIIQIASLVGASQNTIAVHRDNLRQKLGCRDSRELVVLLARLYAGQKSSG